MKTHPTPIRAALAALGLLLLPVLAFAGPPLICHPYAIGEARSLPGGAQKGTDPSYDRTHLVRDTLGLLTPDTPVLVRMETLRRAAIYATGNLRAWGRERAYTDADRALALALLGQLRERTVRTTEAGADLAVFDLGFYMETLRQTELEPGLDGYDLLRKVAVARPGDPDIQFALALASIRPKRPEHLAHVEQARNGAKPGTLLAENLRSHFQR